MEKRHSVSGDDIVNAFLIQIDGTRRCGFYPKRAESLAAFLLAVHSLYKLIQTIADNRTDNLSTNTGSPPTISAGVENFVEFPFVASMGIREFCVHLFAY